MSLSILAVDDEPAALNALCRAIREAVPDCALTAFTDPVSALAAVNEGKICASVAFLDVEMFALTGLELAKSLKERAGEMNIVFVTGFRQYMGEAFRLHASGYLLKPVRPEDIVRELTDLRHPVARAGDKAVRVQCFGNFEVFGAGRPLCFQRSKSKELLAYLVMRRGAGCTISEVAAILWEDEIALSAQQSYLRHLVSDLNKTLKRAGAEGMLLHKRGVLAVEPNAFDCDYYDFIRGDVQAVNAYLGEFMSQYSWAEFTIGYLDARAGQSDPGE